MIASKHHDELDIFERSVDHSFFTPVMESQTVFDSPNGSLVRFNTHPLVGNLSSSSLSRHVLEDLVPPCLDAASEIFTNDDINLDKVAVLSKPLNILRRYSSGLILPNNNWSNPQSPITNSGSASTTSVVPLQRRNTSISRRLSEIYFNTNFSNAGSSSVSNVGSPGGSRKNQEEIVPFYSYYDMIESENIEESRRGSLATFVNESILDDFISGVEDNDIEVVENDYDLLDDEEPLSVCSMGELLKSKSCELRAGGGGGRYGL